MPGGNVQLQVSIRFDVGPAVTGLISGDSFFISTTAAASAILPPTPEKKDVMCYFVPCRTPTRPANPSPPIFPVFKPPIRKSETDIGLPQFHVLGSHPFSLSLAHITFLCVTLFVTPSPRFLDLSVASCGVE